MNELVRIKEEAALFQPATTLALAWRDWGQPTKTSVRTEKLRAEIWSRYLHNITDACYLNNYSAIHWWFSQAIVTDKLQRHLHTTNTQDVVLSRCICVPNYPLQNFIMGKLHLFQDGRTKGGKVGLN